VSVCGFDDDPLAVKIWPELTTMHQPIAQIAERGMAELVQRLRDPGKEAPQPEAIYLPYTLIQRESVGRVEG
jgi:LacI family transcriptional regulator